MFGGFGGKTNSFWVGLQVWEVLVEPKVAKFYPDSFWAVLMENDKNCPTNPVGEGGVLGKTNTFLVGLQVCEVLVGAEVTKFLPEYFWVVLM